MRKMILLIVIEVLVLVILATMVIHSQKECFNDGVCPICGAKLEYFGSDSHGARGYRCKNCDYYTWVSWNTVDKKYWRVR